MTEVTCGPCSKPLPLKIPAQDSKRRIGETRDALERTLKNHAVWLALTYVGLILLMARTYA